MTGMRRSRTWEIHVRCLIFSGQNIPTVSLLNCAFVERLGTIFEKKLSLKSQILSAQSSKMAIFVRTQKMVPGSPFCVFSRQLSLRRIFDFLTMEIRHLT